MKTMLVTSRQWNAPQIETYCTTAEIGSKIAIDDVIEALVEQIGNPTALVTKAQLRSKLTLAFDQIVLELKNATKYVA
jgi:hypothetical protein